MAFNFRKRKVDWVAVAQQRGADVPDWDTQAHAECHVTVRVMQATPGSRGCPVTGPNCTLFTTTSRLVLINSTAVTALPNYEIGFNPSYPGVLPWRGATIVAAPTSQNEYDRLVRVVEAISPIGKKIEQEIRDART